MLEGLDSGTLEGLDSGALQGLDTGTLVMQVYKGDVGRRRPIGKP